MIFAWDQVNRDHLAKHNVSPEEAEQIVTGARPPFPAEIGDQKLIVWGQTLAGRYLQVIFVLKSPQEVEYEAITMAEWLEVETHGTTDVVRIIHAMDLTPTMKRQFHRRQR